MAAVNHVEYARGSGTQTGKYPWYLHYFVANKVLRLCPGMEKPSNELKLIVYFILKSYMPVWFNIRKTGTL